MTWISRRIVNGVTALLSALAIKSASQFYDARVFCADMYKFSDGGLLHSLRFVCSVAGTAGERAPAYGNSSSVGAESTAVGKTDSPSRRVPNALNTFDRDGTFTRIAHRSKTVDGKSRKSNTLFEARVDDTPHITVCAIVHGTKSVETPNAWSDIDLDDRPMRGET